MITITNTQITQLIQDIVHDTDIKITQNNSETLIIVEYDSANTINTNKNEEINSKMVEAFPNLDYKIAYVPKYFSQKKPQKAPVHKQKIPQINKIILVASGKGGVGKSTVSANLAISLAKMGWKVGLLDADIYGASIPTIFDLVGHEAALNDNQMMIPQEIHGIKINSIEFITKGHEALIWRGPMISKVLKQLINNTAWGELDYLIVDTPPGTGDIHITFLENYQLDGYLLVSTPHQISLNNTSKTHQMFRRFDIQNLAFVLNMTGSNDDGELFEAGNLATVNCDSKIIRIPFISKNKNSLFVLDEENSKYFIELARTIVEFNYNDLTPNHFAQL